MGAVWARSRAELRRRFPAWLVVGLLAGIGGGIVMGAFAAAARVEQTYPDFVANGAPMDVLVPGASPFGLVGGVDLNEVGRLPEVAETADASASLLFAGHLPDGRVIGPGDLFPVATAGNALGSTFERFSMLEGRAAHQYDEGEATASFLAADQLGLKVGDKVRIHFFAAKTFYQSAGALITQFNERLNTSRRGSADEYAKFADGPNLTFTVVGIEASPAEFPPLPADISPTLHLTRAFYEKWNSQIVQSPLLYTRLVNGSTDLPSFERRVERMAGDQPVAFVTTRATQTARVQRAITVQATAIRIFAIIVLAAFVVLLQQTIARQVRIESEDDRTLRSIGFSSRQVLALPLVSAALVAVPATVVAIGIAILLSPFGVIGLAHTADPHPGYAFDTTVITLGALAVLVVVPLLTLWPASRRARNARTSSVTEAPGRPSRTARLVAKLGAPPATSVGVNFGLAAGRGTAAIPVQSAIIGFTLGIGLIVATLGFGSSLQHLLDTPHLYGWTWDVKSGAPALPDIGRLLSPALLADENIQDASGGSIIQMDLNQERVDALAVDRVKGSIDPAVIEGRAPRRVGELLVGRKTLEAVGRGVGDSVTARVGSRTARLRIVGVGVFPPFGDVGQFGAGALMTYGQLKELVPEARQNVFLLKFTPETPVASEYSHVRNALEPLPSRLAQRPSDLQNLSSIGGLQVALVTILGALAAATLAHTLLTSVRRRRKSIAVLRTLGFARRQVSAVVVVQALTLVVIALALGTALGILGGRLAWKLFADNLGIESTTPLPRSGIAVLVVAALALAVGVAAIPAWIASRTQAAAALHDQ